MTARYPKTNSVCGLPRTLFAGFAGALYLQGKAMTLNAQTIRHARHTSIFLAIFLSLFNTPLSTLAMGNALALPGFVDFSKSIQNGTDGLRGVYVADVLALPVVQQPVSNAAFVSSNDNEITQFGMASQYGNVGLLAHNTLSGKSFSKITVGQEIRLVYGDGKVEYFIVTEVLRYQATQPTSPYSSFRNIAKDETLTAEQMFKRVYLGDRHVTFQTCINANGSSSWGRLFVIAMPKPQAVGLDRYSSVTK